MPESLAAQPLSGCSKTDRRVLWVEAEGSIRPFGGQENFELIKTLVNDWGVTDIYAQVYRAGRSWFPSVQADDTPYFEAMSAGINPLHDLIQFAHAHGVRVHAWMNVFSLAQNDRAPVLETIGEDGILRDEFGVSLRSYDSDGRAPREPEDRLDTPAIWIDPGSTRYRLYFAELIKELTHLYPALDGVHLDMIRYPYMMLRPDFSGRRAQLGFSEEAMRRYFGNSQSPAECVASIGPEAGPLSWVVLTRGLPRGAGWDSWRREQVTDLVRHVRAELLDRPMELSAAVLAPYDRAYVYAQQPWKEWLAEGLIDFAVAMAYQRGVERYRSVTADVLHDTDGKRVIMGVGAWLSLHDPQVLAEQIRIACDRASGGVSLFSFSHLASRQGMRVVKEIQQPRRESQS